MNDADDVRDDVGLGSGYRHDGSVRHLLRRGRGVQDRDQKVGQAWDDLQ